MTLKQFPYLDDEAPPAPPLSAETKLRLSLMPAEERIQLVKIATYFAQIPRMKNKRSEPRKISTN